MREERAGKKKRARATLLWCAVAFVAAQGGMALALEWLRPSPRDVMRFVRTRRLLRQVGQGPARSVVVLGSSRAETGVLEERMTERLSRGMQERVVVENFAIAAGGCLRSALILDRLRRDRAPLDLVLVEALPALLNEQIIYADA